MWGIIQTTSILKKYIYIDVNTRFYGLKSCDNNMNRNKILRQLIYVIRKIILLKTLKSVIEQEISHKC